MFQRLVIRIDVEMKTPQLPTTPLNAPNDAACFEIERRPVALGNQRSTADVNNRANRAIRLFLFKGTTKAINAGVAI